MRLFVVTHGDHARGGDDAKTLDGPLTLEGRKQIEALKPQLPKFDKNIRLLVGQMQRHQETAKLLFGNQFDPKIHCSEFVGDDGRMFATSAQAKQKVVNEFWQLIKPIGDENGKDIILVTSREYALMISYLLGGGEAILGKLGPYCVRIEKSRMEGPGTIIEFEV